MIIKKGISLLFMLFSFVGMCQQKETLLDVYLHQIENEFDVTFNYQSEIVKSKTCVNCLVDKIEPLKYHIAYLKKEFNLSFDFISANKIVVYKEKKRSLFLLDLDNQNPIQDVLVINISSKKTWISDEKGEINFKNTVPKKIIVSHLNYGKQTIFLDSLKGNTVYLQKEIQNLDELFLYTYFTDGTYKNKDGNFFIKPKK